MTDRFDPFGFRYIREENQEHVKNMQDRLVPGIDPAEFKVNQLVTVSPNLNIRDRSYTNRIFKITAFNTGHVQLVPFEPANSGELKSIILCVHEHHFYDASSFANTGELGND